MNASSRCPECGSTAYVKRGIHDGTAVLWLHCFGCGWESAKTGVFGIDDLKARYADDEPGQAVPGR
jgi:ribosomal protein L37AE/L43A